MEEVVRERAAVLFGALAHATRLRIVEILSRGELTVNDVAAALELAQTSASQHLAVLARAGVLEVEQRRSSRFYRLRGPRVGRVMGLIEEFCHIHGLYGAGVSGAESTQDASRFVAGSGTTGTCAESGR